MLTKRNREFPPQKSDAASFAAKATDLQALRDSVVDAAGVSTGLWLSYLFVLFYFAIATGAVTHRDLFLENPVKLPFLNVELPLKAFFVLGPLVFVVVHAYVLLHFVLLAGKIGAFDVELEAQIAGDDVKARLRRQLPSNIFMQSLAGPHEERTGTIGFLLRLIGRISLVAGPIALLVLFQLQFLPYHNEPITMWQRAAVVIDLGLLWILWPPIERGETARLRWSDFSQVKVQALLLVSILPVLLVFTIATFPGEWLEENLLSMPLVPTTWAAILSADERALQGWATLHELLVAGNVNLVTDSPKSFWSNVLILPDFKAGDRVKFDAEGKISIGSDSLSLRGRNLQGAVFARAHLGKADFTGAQLQYATFTAADLREAKFECDSAGAERKCAQLQGANLAGAQLQGTSLLGAQLQQANLAGAQLQWANLGGAQLQRADLTGARLQGADLSLARLQVANLLFAQLRGANLRGAQLQRANLMEAQLQGADLSLARLQVANLLFAQLQGANLAGAQLQGAGLNGAQLEGAGLGGARLQGANLGGAQLQGAGLERAQLQGAWLDHVLVWRTDAPDQRQMSGALVDTPEPGAKYLGCDAEPFKVCYWTETTYAALKSLIESSVPAGGMHDEALKRIAKLEKPPYVPDQTSAQAWMNLAEASRKAAADPDTLAKTLIGIGCASDRPPYVVIGLIAHLDNRFGGHPSQKVAVAKAFIDERNCFGARGLSAADKASLHQIIDAAPNPSPAGPKPVGSR